MPVAFCRRTPSGGIRVVRNPDLRNACQAWVIAASRFCADRRGFSQGHFHIDFGSGVHLLRATETLDYRFLLRSEAVELGSLPESTAVLHTIQGDPIICTGIFGQAPWPRPGEDWPEGFWEFSLAGGLLSALLARYFAQCDFINRADKTAIDQVAFDYVYNQFEQFIFEPETIPISWLYQFRNLKTAVESTDLSDGIRIRRPSSSEQEQ